MKIPNTIKTIQEAVKEQRVPILVGRVSTSKQRKGLPDQMEFLRQRAKELGFKKKPVEFAIQQSGKSGELRSLSLITDEVKANPKRKYVAIFRDSTRVARDTENALALVRQLTEIGVPLITGDISTLIGKKPMGDRGADLLFIVLSGIAQTGKEAEEAAREKGEAAAKERGLIEGVPRNLYLQQYRQRGISIHRQIAEAQPMRDNKSISGKGLSTLLGISDAQRRKIEKELNAMSDKTRSEYLDVVDAILGAEKIVGRRDRTPASSRTRKQKALHRVTVGYLQFPDRFPRPDTEGNPAVAEASGQVGSGTINDAMANPTRYQPRR